MSSGAPGRYLAPLEARTSRTRVEASGVSFKIQSPSWSTSRARATGEEVARYAAAALIRKLEMTRPAAGEPPDVEWRARTISRASRSENVEDPSRGFRSLLQNPVTVLTHDRDSIVNDCLAGGESGKKVFALNSCVSPN